MGSGAGTTDTKHNGVMRTFDVVIAGAGMVGASLGCALGRAGVHVALVDPVVPKPFESESAPDIRVSALSPASIDFSQ